MREADKNRAETIIQENYDLNGEFSRLAVVSAGTVAAIVGAWALTCLASGIVAVGGPAGLASGWLKAVIG